MNDVPATGIPPHESGRPGTTARIVATRTRPAPIAADGATTPLVCPFLRAIDDDDALGAPIEAPDPVNRCTALGEAVPQSLRQQELVCLTSGHVSCPRYLRGSYVPTEPVKAVLGSRTLTPAIAAALVVLALAFLGSLAFVVANDGLALSAAASPPGTGGVLGDVATPSPTAVPTVTPTPTPTPSPSPSPSPTPTASPIPTATPTPTPIPTPRSDRYKLLKPCPDAPNCYLYVVRSGDNLSSIATYFGIPFNTVQAMNPWTKRGLQVGRALRLPPPTR